MCTEFIAFTSLSWTESFFPVCVEQLSPVPRLVLVKLTLWRWVSAYWTSTRLCFKVSVRWCSPGFQRSVQCRLCSSCLLKLARRGLDVVLVSRCNNKLQNVAKQIGELQWKKKQTNTICLFFTLIEFNLLIVWFRGCIWAEDSHHSSRLHWWQHHLSCYSARTAWTRDWNSG